MEMLFLVKPTNQPAHVQNEFYFLSYTDANLTSASSYPMQLDADLGKLHVSSYTLQTRSGSRAVAHAGWGF